MEGSPTVNKTKAAEEYLKRHSQLFNPVDIEERRCCSLDFKHILSDKQFMEDWPDFEQHLLDEPEHTINCLGLAIHQFTLNELEKEMNEEDRHTIDLPALRVRLLNYEPLTQLKNLKANLYGKLVCVRGTIIRVSNMKLLCTWLGFQCNTCGSVQTVKQQEGLYTQPTVCGSPTCRVRSFTPLCSSSLTQTLNWQTVRLQELVDDDQREGGRVPRTVEVELTEDLVDSCVPGDEVTITGVVKVRSTEEGKKSKSASMFVLYILGVSIVSSKASTGSGRMSGIEFNIKDYYAIQEIHGEPSLFRLLVNSLCPSIYGHEMVKAGLLLGLLGGSQTNHGRSDSHILVVGDPGLGKSQMLQACASVAPRGVYVCGNTSTASGLTVTLTREGGGDFALEAGALVLADQGCCCIDEFDKMSVQHQALLEAMEQQVISIAKAGVVCSLPARTAILAAANPASGHYNRAKTVSENLRMGQPLLSRFDLVFILLDRPNEQLDSLLSEHVMALHSGVKQVHDRSSVTGSTQSNLPECDLPLSERLKLNGEQVDLLPHVLLRKYIAYARKYVSNVRLSGDAARVLQHFYLELRKQHQTLDSTPVTTRQLESLIRLTQARAKAELREEATEQDAVDVVELMRWSMVDTFIDEFGALDFHRSIHGSGSSSKNQAKKFITALQKRAELQTKSVFSVTEMKEVAALAKIQIGDFYTFVSNLNTQGFLIKKGKHMYQLLSVDY
ncbi:DNA helicase MCM8-like isoform X2 [Macrosteles quadrilineatus]|nr:DNA helicase MCM8-like isoform X2 [Macrosteles quadrilineatus]